MKTILELIESWKPCYRYKLYRDCGDLHAGMSIDDILYSKGIDSIDKSWFFQRLFNGHLHIAVLHNKVEVFNYYYWNTYTYTYTIFLSMVDEYLEHADIDAAI